MAAPKTRKKKLMPCPMQSCWEVTPGGKLCGACSSWWYRVQLKSALELGDYLRRLDRFSGRSHRLHLGDKGRRKGKGGKGD